MPPRDYQLVAHDLMLATGGLILTDQVGMGKTYTSLLTLSDPALRPALVVTLAGRIPQQWVEALGKQYPDLRAHVVDKSMPYDLTDADGRTPDLVVMNYAKLAGWGRHLAGRVRTVIFDEVQELRREGTAKRDAACLVADQATVKVGLSATPVYNFGGEMYSILRVLRPEIVGNRHEFAREWCLSTNGLDSKTRIADPEAFREWLLGQGAMLGRTREQVGLTMPPAYLHEHFVDVDQKVAQDGMSGAMEIACLILDDGASSRARWRARGDLDWKMRQVTGVAKARHVADFARLLLQTEKQVVLVGWHREVWSIWQERLADFNPVLYTGSESTARKNRNFEAFRAGDSRVLMLSLRSGAGLDGLQFGDCTTVIFGELDWSPGVHTQVIGRLHRPGQEDPVTAYFCVSDFGADPHMRHVLDLKAMEAALIVDPDSLSAGAVQEEDHSEHLLTMARALVKGVATE